jgi:ATP/maltotriose-dependent transcriptional regulator MalT
MSARARALLDQCTFPPTPALRGIDGELPLSRREWEVAVLAARGRSNHEIAGELVVSVRTVENHLYRIYEKLEVSGRSELGPLLLPGA